MASFDPNIISYRIEKMEKKETVNKEPQSKSKQQKISFQSEDGGTEEFFVEEQTRIGGTEYLLVSDSPGEEASAYILKDVSADEDPQACYQMVEDEREMEAVFEVFRQMLEDVDLEM